MSTQLNVVILAVGDVELFALLLVVAAAMTSALVKTLRGHAGRTHTPSRRVLTPTPFSYWYALVPFEDNNGAKERPVLVLRLDRNHARVLKATSQAKPGRTNYRRIDTSRWERPGQREGSWVQTDKVVTVPLAGFRRRLGHEHNAFEQRGDDHLPAGV